MNQFKIIGYYISEVIDMPRYLKKLGERLLSVSSCLGEMHPKLECCFVNAWSDEEKRAYRIRMKLSEGQYADYMKTVQDLFASRRLDSDCRFRNLWDAVDFYEKFCGAVPCCLVCVSTTSEYYEILSEEMADGYDSRRIEGEPDENPLAGYDILGWDIGGFHSFLCNSLQEELPEAVFNGMGLVGNAFDDAAGFARRIQGKGEPVEWIPCRVGMVRDLPRNVKDSASEIDNGDAFEMVNEAGTV